MSEHVSQILSRVCVTVASVGIIGWVVFQTIRKAEDPVRMAFKWVLTAVLLPFMVLKVGPMLTQNPIVALGLLGFCSVVLAVTWRHSIAALVAEPFGALFTGGNEPPESRPAYSVAQSRQKQGRYVEAAAEIRKQLERFPTDFEGQMLLAQIQAENLKDLPGAELTIQQLCSQTGHAPRNIAFALYSLADWHLKYGPNREAAQRALEQVIALLPETEFALTAAQRIAHLGSPDMPLPHERRKFTVTEGPKNLGLARGPTPVAPVEEGPAERAARLVKHLEQHPMDTDAREQLAGIYLDHYGRYDLAADQLEQMLALPNQPHRLKTRWLNVLADFQIRAGGDYETVKQTLERIIELDPKLAAAETARKRIALLKLELKSKTTPAAVKMGIYEQNLGLKGGRKSE